MDFFGSVSRANSDQAIAPVSRKFAHLNYLLNITRFPISKVDIIYIMRRYVLIDMAKAESRHAVPFFWKFRIEKCQANKRL